MLEWLLERLRPIELAANLEIICDSMNRKNRKIKYLKIKEKETESETVEEWGQGAGRRACPGLLDYGGNLSVGGRRLIKGGRRGRKQGKPIRYLEQATPQRVRYSQDPREVLPACYDTKRWECTRHIRK